MSLDNINKDDALPVHIAACMLIDASCVHSNHTQDLDNAYAGDLHAQWTKDVHEGDDRPRARRWS